MYWLVKDIQCTCRVMICFTKWSKWLYSKSLEYEPFWPMKGAKSWNRSKRKEKQMPKTHELFKLKKLARLVEFLKMEVDSIVWTNLIFSLLLFLIIVILFVYYSGYSTWRVTWAGQRRVLSSLKPSVIRSKNLTKSCQHSPRGDHSQLILMLSPSAMCCKFYSLLCPLVLLSYS